MHVYWILKITFRRKIGFALCFMRPIHNQRAKATKTSCDRSSRPDCFPHPYFSLYNWSACPISPLSLCPSLLFPSILRAAARVYSPESALSLLTHFQGLPTALWITPRPLTGHSLSWPCPATPHPSPHTISREQGLPPRVSWSVFLSPCNYRILHLLFHLANSPSCTAIKTCEVNLNSILT